MSWSIGFLILAGAVNTAIIGSNGVLNRVAEDGVLPDWFLKPHPQIRHDLSHAAVDRRACSCSRSSPATAILFVLGEAYAFGVVWSFVFKALAMVVLRFRDRNPREFKVPFNIKIGTLEFPIGLILIFLVLLTAAIANLFTKDVATDVGHRLHGRILGRVHLSPSTYYHRRRKGAKHEHHEQFNRADTTHLSPEGLGLSTIIRIASWSPFARRRICSCSKRRWPNPIRRRRRSSS